MVAFAGIITAIALSVTGNPEEIGIRLPNGANLTAFRGEWSEWSDGTCSVSCGEGVKIKERFCEGKAEGKHLCDLNDNEEEENLSEYDFQELSVECVFFHILLKRFPL